MRDCGVLLEQDAGPQLGLCLFCAAGAQKEA